MTSNILESGLLDRVRRARTDLAAAQKSSKGAPAYSRWVNRPLGRYFAAWAYALDLTPNQVTALSAAATFSGIAVIALLPATPVTAILATALLVLGYALDAADGQLARLQGSGSPAGEWLDHVTDAIKVGSIHLAVLISWFRFFDLPPALLLVPIGFQVVASVNFFAMILTDVVRRRMRGVSGHFMAGEGTSSRWYSFAVLPTDYGLLCLVFLLLGWRWPFTTVYVLLFLANALFVALALPRWYREVRRSSQEAAGARGAGNVGQTS